MPNCDCCQAQVEEGETRSLHDRTLCEDCYMDALSPAKSCDPWATYTASRLPDQSLNPVQDKILALIREKRVVRRSDLLSALGLPEPALDRELAALRHIEKIRGLRLPDGGRAVCAFEDSLASEQE